MCVMEEQEAGGMIEGRQGVWATFGELLRHLRRRAQLTQVELGIALGYSRALVARLC